MIAVEELAPAHLERIKLRQYETETLEAFHVRLDQLVEQASKGPAYAFVKDGEVVAVAGLSYLWGRVWEAWLLSTERLENSPAAARAVVRTLRATEAKVNWQRIQAQAPVSLESAPRWFQFLGLEYEHTARKYTALGEDAVVYAKVKDGH